MSLKPKFWNADKIVSFSAILISLATMAIYLYQTHLIQKQQHASVMPYLRMEYAFYEDGFDFNLSNEGLGPAFINEVNTYYKGKKYAQTDISNFYLSTYIKIDTSITSANLNSIDETLLMPTGNTINLIWKHNDIELAQKLRKLFLSKDLILEIKYSSIYGDKWVVKGVQVKPTKIED